MFAIAEADPMRHVRELTTEAGPVLKLSEFHFLPICQTNCDEGEPHDATVGVGRTSK
jgi:hypothetical protein